VRHEGRQRSGPEAARLEATGSGAATFALARSAARFEPTSFGRRCLDGQVRYEVRGARVSEGIRGDIPRHRIGDEIGTRFRMTGSRGDPRRRDSRRQDSGSRGRGSRQRRRGHNQRRSRDGRWVSAAMDDPRKLIRCRWVPWAESTRFSTTEKNEHLNGRIAGHQNSLETIIRIAGYPANIVPFRGGICCCCRISKCSISIHVKKFG
jgi:hypothetical protein